MQTSSDVAAVAVLCFPAIQDVQKEAAKPPENLPSSQAMQELTPSNALAFPSSQFRHTSGLEAPAVGPYFPSAQDTHTDASVTELGKSAGA